MAIKTAEMPLVIGAPSWLASPVWGYLPLALVSFYLLVALSRKLLPARLVEPQSDTPSTHEADLKALATLRIAKDDAAIASSQGGVLGPERTWPKVKAALLTAQRHFQLPLPPESGDAGIDMQTGRRYIESVLPFLREGHFDAAKHEAEAFIRSLD